jgi:hypothetical protein
MMKQVSLQRTLYNRHHMHDIIQSWSCRWITVAQGWVRPCSHNLALCVVLQGGSRTADTGE